MKKIAHFSDLHYCAKHLETVDAAFGEAIQQAIAENCALAIISGDSFDSALHVHEPAFAAYVRRMVQLASAMPVVVLQGTFSHDRLGMLDSINEIGQSATRHPILVADEPAQLIVPRC